MRAAQRLGAALLAIAGSCGTMPAGAEFALALSPPRFEIEAKPGELVRRTLEVTNAATRAAVVTVRTADWTYGPDGSVDFLEPLATGSCRPWVAIERRELTVTPGRPYRFRFEVAVPPGTPPGECRFAILIEGQDERADAGGLMVPFNARMAVVVYLGVGGAQPALSVVGSAVEVVDGRPLPVLRIRNSGGAHGRLGGFLAGIDADNRRLDFTPATIPILPGETRSVPLLASRPGDPDSRPELSFPVTVRGKLEWDKNQSQDIDQRFAR